MREADTARVIEGQVGTLSITPTVPVYFEQQPRPDDVAEFVTVAIRPGVGKHTVPGQPEYRYAGVVIAQVFVPPETGTRRARAIGDAFAARWRAAGGKPLALTDAQAGTLRFFTPYVSRVMQDGPGAPLQLNVSVPFSRELTLS